MRTVAIAHPDLVVPRASGPERNLFAVRRELGPRVKLGRSNKAGWRTDFALEAPQLNSPDVGIEDASRVGQALALVGKSRVIDVLAERGQPLWLTRAEGSDPPYSLDGRTGRIDNLAAVH